MVTKVRKMKKVSRRTKKMKSRIIKKTRTQHIREYLSSLKPSERSPTAISKALRKKGVKVTANHVCMVKSDMGMVKKKNRVANSFNLHSTLIAKNLLRACRGDLTLAKTNLNLVSRLMG